MKTEKQISKIMKGKLIMEAMTFFGYQPEQYEMLKNYFGSQDALYNHFEFMLTAGKKK
jgi:hypothetical protein